MPGIFRSNNPFNVFLIFFLGIILRLHVFNQPQGPVVMPADGFLYVGMVKWMESIFGKSSIFFPSFAYVLIFLQAVLLNTFVNKHKMFGRSNYITAFAYVVLTAVRPEWWAFSSSLVVNAAIIPVWNNLVGLYKSQKAKSILFSTGLIIGLISFFYFPAIHFVLLLLVSVLIMRPFRLPEWITGILGVLIPYYFLFSFSFLMDKWDLKHYLPLPSWGIVPLQKDKWTFILIVYIALTLILGFYHLLNSMNRLAINSRKAWNLVFYYLILAAVLPFLSASKDLSYFLLAIPAVAATMANLLYYPQNRLLPYIMTAGLLVYVLLLNFL